MGYTHYFPQARSLTPVEWEALENGVERLVAATAIPLCRVGEDHPVPPQITSDEISFNGVGDDGHETFLITRQRDPNFQFCKTARKPYDELVVAVLAYLGSALPGAFEIESDGGPAEWQAGIALAREAWPDQTIDFQISGAL